MTTETDIRKISQGYVDRYQRLTWILRGVFCLVFLDMVVLVVTTLPSMLAGQVQLSSVATVTLVGVFVGLSLLIGLTILRSRWQKSYDAAKLMV